MKDHLQMSKERAEKARERSKTSKIASNPSVKFLLSMTRDSLMARIAEWPPTSRWLRS